MTSEFSNINICSLNSESNGTCIPDNILIKIKNKIIPKIITKNKKEIIESLAHETLCSIGDLKDKELCILNKIDDKKNTIKYFKPETKSFSNDYWLNNTEIDSIQYQFQNLFKGYYYSNIHMIDLGTFSPNNSNILDNNTNICSIVDINFVNELKQQKNKLNYNGELKNYGIVVNTDSSNGGGLHWFSIFIDFTSTPITIEYFNSSGYDIKNIKFKKYFYNLADEITLNYKKCIFVKVSDIQHQKSNTSNCGSYALYYIWKRLNGEPYEYFSKNKVTDEHMCLFRKYMFRLK